MSEEEKAALKEQMLKSFPVEKVIVGGVEYEYFAIELKVTIDGEERYERYGFREENGEWFLTSLARGRVEEE